MTNPAVIAVVAVLGGAIFLLIGIAIGLARSSVLQKRAEEARKKQLDQYASQSLRRNGYDTGNLVVDLDAENKKWTISSGRSSHTFDIDCYPDPRSQWRVYIYDTNGDRKVMSPEAFEGYVNEVSEAEQRFRHQAFPPKASEEPATA